MKRRILLSFVVTSGTLPDLADLQVKLRKNIGRNDEVCVGQLLQNRHLTIDPNSIQVEEHDLEWQSGSMRLQFVEGNGEPVELSELTENGLLTVRGLCESTISDVDDKLHQADDESPVKDDYENGECPDCGTPIPDEATAGDECSNCGHVFWHAQDND